MLELHTWATQNARKIAIMLEECGLDYVIRPVNIETGEQFDQAFVSLNPNSKIPVLVDPAIPQTPIFETGAILLYLAEKSGRFLPSAGSARVEVTKWLFWQTSSMGPAFGNFSHFASALADEKMLNAFLAKTRAPDPNMYAIQRFSKISLELLRVLDTRLADRDFVAGDLSIADFAIYPWVESAWLGFQQISPTLEKDHSHISAWMERMSRREAVARAMEALAWGKTLNGVSAP